MMADVVAQLLPLFPAVPLIAAAIALLAPRRAVRDTIMLIVPGIGVVAGLGLLFYTMTNGVVAHTVGLYVGNVGIPLVADAFAALMISTTMKWPSALIGSPSWAGRRNLVITPHSP